MKNIDYYLFQVMDNGKIEIDGTLFSDINIFAVCGRGKPRNYATTFHSDCSTLACHIYVDTIYVVCLYFALYIFYY